MRRNEWSPSPECAPITVEPENDKNPVVALREIAARTILPGDMREGLIHSIQHNVEIDEPEVVAAPLALVADRPILGRDSPSTDTTIETMTERFVARLEESVSGRADD